MALFFSSTQAVDYPTAQLDEATNAEDIGAFQNLKQVELASDVHCLRACDRLFAHSFFARQRDRLANYVFRLDAQMAKAPHTPCTLVSPRCACARRNRLRVQLGSSACMPSMRRMILHVLYVV